MYISKLYIDDYIISPSSNCSIYLGNFEARKNDIGTIFRASIKNDCGVIFDVSECTNKYLIFRNPNGIVSTKVASFYTNGEDGVIQYTTVENDLGVVGIWSVQAYVVFVDGEWKTNIRKFKVLDNI